MTVCSAPDTEVRVQSAFPATQGRVGVVTNITRRLAAVAFADVAGWSRLVEDNDLNALQAWKALRTGFIEPKILEYGGRLVDAAGDAVFVEFLSAVQAVSWARDLQARPISAGIDDLGCQLRLRIGINEIGRAHV